MGQHGGKGLIKGSNGSVHLKAHLEHPTEWSYCGYNEIQEPKRKNVLIDYEKLRELLGFDTYDRVSIYYKRWVEDYLGNGKNIRNNKWTKSIAACPVNCLSIFNRGWR
jgi:hypothetical protein